MDKLSYIKNSDITYINEMFRMYQQNPNLVDYSWQRFFEGFIFASKNNIINNSESDVFNNNKSIVQDYFRKNGHLFANTNPLKNNIDFNKSALGITDDNLEDTINLFKKIYCSSISFEYLFIEDNEARLWLQNKIEENNGNILFSKEDKWQFVNDINKAVCFEQFLHSKFAAQKRFSLQGAESLIPALNYLIKQATSSEVEDVIIGMPHRGRLNVLANVLQKDYQKFFAEFDGLHFNNDESFWGDVKYHQGYSTEVINNNNIANVNLCYNPSHLEAVDGVVLGLSRAKISKKYNGNGLKVLPIIIHGDASVAAQGIVYETLQMFKLNSYSTSGTIHIVVNNQIGFTTDTKDARSTLYCTDIAKTFQIPVIHVNANDVDAVCWAVDLSLQYRMMFKSDIFIDLVCYRLYGHNEGDEPRFTQPLMYKEIEKQKNIFDIYSKSLIDSSICTESEILNIYTLFNDELNKKLEQVKLGNYKYKFTDFNNQSSIINKQSKTVLYSYADLVDIANQIFTLPSNASFLPKIERIYSDRLKMFNQDKIDWAMAEMLAFALLVKNDFWVRFSGEDVKRGTFSHRHAVVFDNDNNEINIINEKYGNDLTKFELNNSLLSEYGALAYEYGFALENLNGLTIWEAQFGDFVNNAQVVLDQFIVSSEIKWNIKNSLAVILPHSYEGQGPEHSSARIERIMEECANDNIYVVNCSTPAQLFNLLIRHTTSIQPKPLFILSHKSLLRLDQSFSNTNDLLGGFKEIILDNIDSTKVIKVLFCCGKIYYDLVDYRNKCSIDNVAIIRIEQIYPFPEKQYIEIRKKYSNCTFAWVQEEPENMGVAPWFTRKISKDIEIIARPESSSPATGFSKLHQIQQLRILEKAFL